MISCDEVFDVLTRGPFPTGRPSDGVVESHLAHCPDCQRLAEALRPAVELFEAVAPEESRTLPSYAGRVRASTGPVPWEAVLAEALPVVPTADANLNTSKIPVRQNWKGAFFTGTCPVNLARFAAAALLGAVIAGAAFQWAAPQLQTLAKKLQANWGGGNVAMAGGNRDRVVEGRYVEIHNVKLFLPWACQSNPMTLVHKDLPKGPAEVANWPKESFASGDNVLSPKTTDYHEKACCTKCHNSDSGYVLADSTTRLIQQCAICHARPKNVN